MTDYIILLLDKLIADLNDSLIALSKVVEELESLQARFPELAAYLEDEIADFSIRIERTQPLKLEVIALKKKFTNPTSAARIIFLDEEKKEIDNMFLKVNQKAKISLAIKDKFGNAAQVDGKPAWALTDESLASLAVSEDGLSADLEPKGPIGSFSVQVSCDADLGEGVKEIIGSLPVDLSAGDAEVVELSAEIL